MYFVQRTLILHIKLIYIYIVATYIGNNHYGFFLSVRILI